MQGSVGRSPVLHSFSFETMPSQGLTLPVHGPKLNQLILFFFSTSIFFSLLLFFFLASQLLCEERCVAVWLHAA